MRTGGQGCDNSDSSKDRQAKVSSGQVLLRGSRYKVRDEHHRRSVGYVSTLFLPSQLVSTGATTVGTGEDWSPTFKLGEQQCTDGLPNFLAVVFKKQEISQRVLFYNLHLIVFFVLTTRDNRGRKFVILN